MSTDGLRPPPSYPGTSRTKATAHTPLTRSGRPDPGAETPGDGLRGAWTAATEVLPVGSRVPGARRPEVRKSGVYSNTYSGV